MKYEEQKDNVIDYINGHLSGDQLKEFEAELATNQQLADDLEQSKAWQATLQSQEAAVAMPQFSSIEHKLNKSSWNWGYGLSTAAAVALAAFLFLGTSFQPNNEFETLTDTNSAYNTPVMQIVLSKDATLADIMSDYSLSVVKTYPNEQIIDININANLDVEALEKDKRIVFVKRIGSEK